MSGEESMLALAGHRQFGRVDALLLSAGLPALLALPVALAICETKKSE